MSELPRTSSDVLHDIEVLIYGGGVARVFLSIEDYELLVSSSPLRLAASDDTAGAFMNLAPTAYGRPVEWRMFYHGAPTATEPTRRKEEKP